MNHLPNKLLKLRKHSNYSQSRLAKVLGVDTLEYMGFENGRSVLSYAQMKKLASFYHIEVKDIFLNMDELPYQEENNTSTDEINYAYFIPKKSFFDKFMDEFRKHVFIYVGILSALILVIGISIGVNASPAEPYVAVVKNVNRLSASDTSVVYIDKNGAVKGSGDNSNSQLSNLMSDGAIEVAEGLNYTVVLKNDGTLEAYGLLSKYERDLRQCSGIMEIACGDNHVVALDRNGRVISFGDNSFGQCDFNNYDDVKRVFATANGSVIVSTSGKASYTGEFFGSSMLKNFEDIADIDSSNNILAVLEADGSVRVFSKTGSYDDIENCRDIVDVACGDEYVAALGSNGKVTISVDNVTIRDEVSRWENIIAISSGKNYLIAFDGEKIYGVGKNDYRQFEKGEISKQTLPQVSNVIIGCTKDFVSVEFNPVVNASGYVVTLEEGMGHSVQAKDNEVSKLPSNNLIYGKTYTIVIVTKGENDYADSSPLSINFVYEYEVEERNVVAEEETKFTLETLEGKTKVNFEAYLSGLGVKEEQLEAQQTEDLCETDEPIILSVEGIASEEVTTKEDLKTRMIKYKYCKVVVDDEQ